MKSPTAAILILFALDLYLGSCMLRPLMRPNQNEIVISAGDAIILECIFTNKIFFYYPHYNEQDGQTIVVTQPKVAETEGNYKHKYVFSRYHAMPNNTGWYGCASRNITITSEVFDDPKFSWIYIYVSSSSQPLIEEGLFRNIIQIAGHTAILPCRPTSPNLTVVLYNDNTDEEVNIGENVTYDPKFGFKLKNLRITDSSSFKCSSTMNGEVHDMMYQLIVERNVVVDFPKVDNNALKHLIRGQNLHVNCTIYLSSHIFYILNWIIPRQSSRVSTQWYTKKIGEETQEVVRELIIKNLTVEDEGEYKCRIDTNANKKETRIYVKVHDKPILKLKGVERYYAPGQNVHIECKVLTSSRPNVTCSFRQCPYYPSKKGSSFEDVKNEITQLETYSFLLNGSVEVHNSGIINCTACSSIGCNYISGNIYVSDGNGDFSILKPKERIIEGDRMGIICAASIYNYSNNITWTKGDEYRPIIHNGSIIVVKEKTSFTYRSILTMQNVRKQDAGFYACSARATNGTVKTMRYNLFVHDQKSPIFRNSNLKRRDLTIDLGKERYNTIILMCYVDGMPKPTVTWYKDDVPLNNAIRKRKDAKDRYLFFNNNQELHIKYLLEQDDGKYSCRATNRLNTIEDYINILIKGKELSKELISMTVILLIIVMILVVYVKIKVRREKILRKELLDSGLMHFEKGALECLSPALTVGEQAVLLPYDKKWEFPRERLKLGKKLGSGAFGVVMKAKAYGICKDEAITTVAVKMVRRASDLIYVRALASELKIMVHLGKHLNVVNLLGACTKNISKRELLVIVEYCRFGNLHNYLLQHRTNFINQIDPTTGKFDLMIGTDILTRTSNVTGNNSISANSETEAIHCDAHKTSDPMGVTTSPDGFVTFNNNSPDAHWRSNYRGDYNNQNVKPICTQDLLSWAFQVARGMEYLAQRKVLHGDLAARNILLAEDNIVKICDFGLARTMYKNGNYKKKGNEPLPIKWMAIESIRDRVFSTQSDIWSFGIVLWEFFTLAETPYLGMEVEKQYEKLLEGYRMERPAYSTNEVYQIMLQCWKAEPTLRPSFAELVNSIGDLLEENVKAHYISLNTSHMYMNTMTLEGKNDYLPMMSAPNHIAT